MILTLLSVTHISGWTYSRPLCIHSMKRIMLCKICFSALYILMLPTNLFFLTA
jgi:hypothetical protein